MVGTGQVKHGVTEQDRQLLMLAKKSTGERMVRGLDYDSLSNPLPELGLRGPKLFVVAANHKRRFLAHPLFIFLHPYTLLLVR